MIYKLVFIAAMTVFVVIQWNVAPFSSPAANSVEFFLLCAVPTVIVAVMPSVVDFEFAEVMLSVMLLLPVPLLLFFVVRLVWSQWKEWIADHVEHREAEEMAEHVIGTKNIEMNAMRTTTEGDQTKESGQEISVDVTPMDNVDATVQTLSVPQSGDSGPRSARESEEWSLEMSGISGGDRSASARDPEKDRVEFGY